MTNLKISGRNKGVVVITGASTGIGRACAERLAHVGFTVFAGVRREQDAREIERSGSPLLRAITLDVANPEMIRDAARRIQESVRESRLAGLVNNAGMVLGGPLEFVALDELRAQFEVNVIGQIAVTQAFLPMLRESKGRVVFVGSSSGRLAVPFLGPYCGSKFALRALTDSLRCELKPWKIPVSLIEPGSIQTPIWDKSVSAAEERRRRYPAPAEDLYGRFIDLTVKASQKLAATSRPVETVVRQVEHALSATRPKANYLVGFDAKQEILLALLPARIRDWIITSYLGLK